MELPFQMLGQKLCALIGAVLDVTAWPIGEGKVRAEEPRSFAVSGGTCEPHAPVNIPCGGSISGGFVRRVRSFISGKSLVSNGSSEVGCIIFQNG